MPSLSSHCLHQQSPTANHINCELGVIRGPQRGRMRSEQQKPKVRESSFYKLLKTILKFTQQHVQSQSYFKQVIYTKFEQKPRQYQIIKDMSDNQQNQIDQDDTYKIEQQKQPIIEQQEADDGNNEALDNNEMEIQQQKQNQPEQQQEEQRVNQQARQQQRQNEEQRQDGQAQQLQVQKPEQKSPPAQNQPNPVNKDAYINKLQTYLNKVRIDLLSKQKSLSQSLQQTKKTKQSLKKVRFDFLSSKQQLSSLNQQKLRLQKEKQNLQNQNQQLQRQLQIFRQAGDINFYKNKIGELEKIVSVQEDQLRMKQVMIDEKDQLNAFVESNSQSKIQILELIQRYQSQKSDLFRQFTQVASVNVILKGQRATLQSQNNQLKLKLSDSQTESAADRQTISQMGQKLKLNQTELSKKIRQLEQQLVASMNEQSRMQVSSQAASLQNKREITKNAEQAYGIKVLSLSQQRDLILREFIQLQVRHESALSQLSSLRQRHYNSLKQIRSISTTHINKKDYSQLYKRYAKLRKCLQSSLINQQQLKSRLQRHGNVIENQHQEGNGKQSSQKEYVFRSLLLQQPQNALEKVEKIMQRSSQTFKPLLTLKQQLQLRQKLIRLEKQVRQKDQRLVHCENQLRKLRAAVQLYDGELGYKDTEIGLLRKSNLDSIQKIAAFEKAQLGMNESLHSATQIQQKRVLIQILEIKNVQILKENNILRSERNNLKQLYTNLKSMYQQILSRQPQTQQPLQSNINQCNNRDQNCQQEQPQRTCKSCLEREQLQHQVRFNQMQAQTQGLGQLYFKEIKQLLTILRKFPKRVETITTILQSEKSTIHDIKKRYDLTIQSYNLKQKQLQEQKKQNQQWRTKQREEIKQEFQDIRDLLMNQRLLSALRKAKYLIKCYEQTTPQGQDGEENLGDQNEQGEINENKNEAQQKREQPIIQESKQNP